MYESQQNGHFRWLKFVTSVLGAFIKLFVGRKKFGGVGITPPPLPPVQVSHV
jgi:hypothetical protein